MTFDSLFNLDKTKPFWMIVFVLVLVAGMVEHAGFLPPSSQRNIALFNPHGLRKFIRFIFAFETRNQNLQVTFERDSQG